MGLRLKSGNGVSIVVQSKINLGTSFATFSRLLMNHLVHNSAKLDGIVGATVSFEAVEQELEVDVVAPTIPLLVSEKKCRKVFVFEDGIYVENVIRASQLGIISNGRRQPDYFFEVDMCYLVVTALLFLNLVLKGVTAVSYTHLTLPTILRV